MTCYGTEYVKKRLPQSKKMFILDYNLQDICCINLNIYGFG